MEIIAKSNSGNIERGRLSRRSRSPPAPEQNTSGFLYRAKKYCKIKQELSVLQFFFPTGRSHFLKCDDSRQARADEDSDSFQVIGGTHQSKEDNCRDR